MPNAGDYDGGQCTRWQPPARGGIKNIGLCRAAAPHPLLQPLSPFASKRTIASWRTRWRSSPSVSTLLLPPHRGKRETVRDVKRNGATPVSHPRELRSASRHPLLSFVTPSSTWWRTSLNAGTLRSPIFVRHLSAWVSGQLLFMMFLFFRCVWRRQQSGSEHEPTDARGFSFRRILSWIAMFQVGGHPRFLCGSAWRWNSAKVKGLLADSGNDKSLAFNILQILVQNCQRTTADDEGFDYADNKKFVTASALLCFSLFQRIFNVSPARLSCFCFFSLHWNNVHWLPFHACHKKWKKWLPIASCSFPPWTCMIASKSKLRQRVRLSASVPWRLHARMDVFLVVAIKSGVSKLAVHGWPVRLPMVGSSTDCLRNMTERFDAVGQLLFLAVHANDEVRFQLKGLVAFSWCLHVKRGCCQWRVPLARQQREWWLLTQCAQVERDCAIGEVLFPAVNVTDSVGSGSSGWKRWLPNFRLALSRRQRVWRRWRKTTAVSNPNSTTWTARYKVRTDATSSMMTAETRPPLIHEGDQAGGFARSRVASRAVAVGHGFFWVFTKRTPSVARWRQCLCSKRISEVLFLLSSHQSAHRVTTSSSCLCG